MTQSQLSSITRRQLIASISIGGAAILAAAGGVYTVASTRQSSTAETEPEWVFPTGEGASDSGWVSSRPVVKNGVVYFGSRNGSFFAVHADDGVEIWRVQSGSSIDASPAVVDGVAYLGNRDGNLLAIDTVDGNEAWRLPTGAEISYAPVVSDGFVYLGNSSVALIVIDAIDGTEPWNLVPNTGSGCSPLVVDGVVCFSNSHGAVHGWPAAGGTELWNSFAVGVGAAIVSLHAGENIVFLGSNVGTIYALDPWTGSEIWQTTISYSATLLTADNGHVYVADGSSLVSIEPATGSELWRYQSSDDTVMVSAVVEAGVVHIGLDFEGIVGLNASDGSELWRISDDDLGLNYSTMAISGGMAFAGDMANGSLFALRLPETVTA